MELSNQQLVDHLFNPLRANFSSPRPDGSIILARTVTFDEAFTSPPKTSANPKTPVNRMRATETGVDPSGYTQTRVDGKADAFVAQFEFVVVARRVELDERVADLLQHVDRRLAEVD